jgi:hypothetical protein
MIGHRRRSPRQACLPGVWWVHGPPTAHQPPPSSSRCLLDDAAATGMLTAPAEHEIRLTPIGACARLAAIATAAGCGVKSLDRKRLTEALVQRANAGDSLSRKWPDSGLVTTLSARAAGRGTGALLTHLSREALSAIAKDAFVGRVTVREPVSLEAACAYLARALAAVISDGGADSHLRLARQWARAAAKEGRDVNWVVPSTGWQAVQPYRESMKRQATVRFGELEIQPAFFEASTRIDVRRQISRAPADIVRSVRAGDVAVAVAVAVGAGLISVGVEPEGYLSLAADAHLLAVGSEVCQPEESKAA